MIAGGSIPIPVPIPIPDGLRAVDVAANHPRRGTAVAFIRVRDVGNGTGIGIGIG
jgi:hypothetical protein